MYVITDSKWYNIVENFNSVNHIWRGLRFALMELIQAELPACIVFQRSEGTLQPIGWYLMVVFDMQIGCNW